MLSIIGCGRSDFEGLLQLELVLMSTRIVVEGPILRDYYNTTPQVYIYLFVVEGPILRDYYNFTL